MIYGPRIYGIAAEEHWMVLAGQIERHLVVVVFIIGDVRYCPW